MNTVAGRRERRVTRHYRDNQLVRIRRHRVRKDGQR